MHFSNSETQTKKHIPYTSPTLSGKVIRLLAFNKGGDGRGLPLHVSQKKVSLWHVGDITQG